MKKRDIGARLLSVAHLVRRGACFADIGTDHAYLPIFLKDEGIISSAVCTDINKGPLDSARRNVSEAGYSDCFSFLLTDGAQGVEKFGVTDVAICGMGGELIARIIENSPFLKDEKIQLCLQPMSKEGTLRSCLYEMGFEILKEAFSSEGTKSYVSFLACYTGKARKLTEVESMLGIDFQSTPKSRESRAYFETKLKAYLRAESGKSLAEIDTGAEKELISNIKEWFERN